MEYDGYFGEKPIATITPRVNHGVSISLPSQHVIGFTRHNQPRLIGFLKQRQTAKERKWLLVSADVRGDGARNKALRLV